MRSAKRRGAKEKIKSRSAAAGQVKAWKRQGSRIVFTNGCFDLLHPGHLQYLERARSLGDRLVVAVNDDASVRRIKGPGRPIQPAEERAEILAALAAVDLVTLFAEPDPLAIIGELMPDVLVKGADWAPDRVVGKDLVESAGGSVVQIDYDREYSTTRLIETVRRNYCPSR